MKSPASESGAGHRKEDTMENNTNPQEYNDLTKYMPRLIKLLPFFLPKKLRYTIIDAMLYVLTL